MNIYTTSEIAKKIGIHPNTVRFYEEMKLITRPKRKENGYRIFTDLHVYQFKIARMAFQIELLQNGLRKQSVDIVKTVALGNIDKALELTDQYLKHIEQEKINAAEAIKTVKNILENDVMPLTQGIKILKAVALDKPIDNMAFSLIIIFTIAIVCTVISIKFFKWE